MPFEEEDNNPFGATNGIGQFGFLHASETNSVSSDTGTKRTENADPADTIASNSASSTASVPIEIVDANKSADGFVIYTIQYNGIQIKRRYREFESLRKSLVALFPTTLVPPIPTKQSFADFLSSATTTTSRVVASNAGQGGALSQSTANMDHLSYSDTVNVVDHRKRMLSIFLKRCLAVRKIGSSSVVADFLNPNLNWKDVLQQPPLSLIPKNAMQCDPIQPEKSTYLHTMMPVPTLPIVARVEGTSLSNSEELRTTETSVMAELDKIDRKCNRYLGDLSKISGELGILFNAFSLQEMDKEAARNLEKVSTIFDQTYLELEQLYKSLYLNYTEPLIELSQFTEIARKLVRFRNKKQVQLKLIESELERKENNLKNLTVGYNNWENTKLNSVIDKTKPSQPSDAVNSSAAGKFKIPGVNKLASVFKEHVYDNDPVKTHKDKVNKLIFDISQLKEMKSLAVSDYQKLHKEIDDELMRYEKYFKSFEFKKLLRILVQNVLEYGRKSLESWEELA